MLGSIFGEKEKYRGEMLLEEEMFFEEGNLRGSTIGVGEVAGERCQIVFGYCVLGNIIVIYWRRSEKAFWGSRGQNGHSRVDSASKS